MERRSTRATAQNPFASPVEPQISLSMHEDFLEGTSWASLSCLPPFVDWNRFLSDTEPDMTMLTSNLTLFADRGDEYILPVLVAVAANVFRSLRSFQAAPTVREGFARLHEMKTAAKKLALLARGEPAQLLPRDEGVASLPFGKRTPALHAFLHDLLQIVDAPNESLRSNEEEWNRSLSNAHRRDRRLRMFFHRLDEIVERLTVPDSVIAELERLDPRQRRTGAPRDGARDWLLTRLMWIWRDAMGKELAIYQPRSGGQVDPNNATPRENSLLAFVCDVLNKLEPVRPHELSALEKKLIELRPRIPKDSLFSR